LDRFTLYSLQLAKDVPEHSMDFPLPPWLIWFLIGLGLSFLELLLPVFVVIFFGIGALITAGVLLVLDLSLTQQILVFVAGSVLSLVALRRSMVKIFQGTTSHAADELDAPPVGVQVKVVRTITPRMQGKISYRGSHWNAVAEEHINVDETAEIIGFAEPSRSTFRVKKI
jgi:inner membrane protein